MDNMLTVFDIISVFFSMLYVYIGSAHYKLSFITNT